MDNIPTGELNFTLPCEKCGSNELAIPCNATGGSAVTCSDCGTGLGSWGDVKAAIDKTTKEREEAPTNFLGLSPLTAPNSLPDIPKLRHRRPDHSKFAVCKPYDRLRKGWQSLVDGTTAPSDSQRLDEEAALGAQQKMVEHRERCEVCTKEDLALRAGELHEMLTAELN
jgi:hypothetical protein